MGEKSRSVRWWRELSEAFEAGLPFPAWAHQTFAVRKSPAGLYHRDTCKQHLTDPLVHATISDIAAVTASAEPECRPACRLHCTFPEQLREELHAILRHDLPWRVAAKNLSDDNALITGVVSGEGFRPMSAAGLHPADAAWISSRRKAAITALMTATSRLAIGSHDDLTTRLATLLLAVRAAVPVEKAPQRSWPRSHCRDDRALVARTAVDRQLSGLPPLKGEDLERWCGARDVNKEWGMPAMEAAESTSVELHRHNLRALAAQCPGDELVLRIIPEPQPIGRGDGPALASACIGWTDAPILGSRGRNTTLLLVQRVPAVLAHAAARTMASTRPDGPVTGKEHELFRLGSADGFDEKRLADLFLDLWEWGPDADPTRAQPRVMYTAAQDLLRLG